MYIDLRCFNWGNEKLICVHVCLCVCFCVCVTYVKVNILNLTFLFKCLERAPCQIGDQSRVYASRSMVAEIGFL